MAFFEQMQHFFVAFILCGLWTSWQNLKYKKYLQLYSIFSIVQIILNFSFSIILNRLYESNSLSNVVANFWFLLSICTHLTIVIESLHQNRSQLKLIRSFTIVDNIFDTKLRIKIAYLGEKRQLFVRLFTLVAIEFITKAFAIVYFSIYQKPIHKFFYVTLHSELMIVFRLTQVLYFISIIDNRLCLIKKKLFDAALHITDQNVFKHKMKKKLKKYRIEVPMLILNVKKIYGELYDSCERIGHIFGWSLLMIIAYIFVNFALNFYWLFMHFSKNEDILFNTILLVRYFIVLGIVAMCCSSCCHQVCN